MASTSNKPHDYTIRHIRPDGSSIQIDPPLSPALQPGQYTRLLNSTLLDARAAADAGSTTVEGAFNRLLGEAEATGLATNCLYQLQKDADDRLRALADAAARDYREVRSTLDGLARIVDNCRAEAATYERRLRAVRAQLLHIYKHGMRPSAAAAAPLELALSLYPAPRAEAYEPAISEAERRFRLRTFGRARGADRVKEEECLRADEEFRVEGLVARLEDAAAAAAAAVPGEGRPGGTVLTEAERPLVEKAEARLERRRVQLAVLAPFAGVLRGGVDALERRERARARALEGRREAVVGGVLDAVRYLRPLRPYLAESEEAAREIERQLHPERGREPIPLVEISFDKPVDEMTEEEMREALRALPATICLDPASLPQIPCAFEDPGAGDPRTEYPEKREKKDEDDEGDVDEEVQGGPETRLAGWRRDRVPGSSVVVRTPAARTGAPSAARFGETSFPGKAAGGASKPPCAFPRVGTRLPGRETGAVGGVASGPPAGMPLSSATPSAGRAVSEGRTAMQVLPAVPRKRARSPTDLTGEDSPGALDADEHSADARVKKRKLA